MREHIIEQHVLTENHVEEEEYKELDVVPVMVFVTVFVMVFVTVFVMVFVTAYEGLTAATHKHIRMKQMYTSETSTTEVKVPDVARQHTYLYKRAVTLNML